MTLLYAAFAAVALWLLGELLLQRRAPLHWRALALVGFLALVAGVAQGSLPMIGAGVVAFGAGQALATRAVKRSDGAAYWSLVAPESVPVVGRLFVGGESSVRAPQGRSRGPRREPVGTAEPEAVPEPLAEPVSEAGAMEATAVFQADGYAVEGDSVYYAPAAEPEQQAAYYAYTAEHQESYQESYPQEQYQEPYAQYQEYPQYTEQYTEQYAQQYAEPQPQYAAYGQQPEYGQQYPSEYAPYGSHAAGSDVPAQPQQGYGGYGGYGGYDYEQTPYYAQDPQYHAPQG